MHAPCGRGAAAAAALAAVVAAVAAAGGAAGRSASCRRISPRSCSESCALCSTRRSETGVAGAGEQEDRVREMASRDPRIHFLGFRNQTELPSLYAASDVLVLPSKYAESWGLVVNEAMAMGCAAIVSNRVGSSADLIEGRDTGLIVPADDPVGLAAALQQCVDDRELLARWQANVRPVITSHTPEQAARGVHEAVWAP